MQLFWELFTYTGEKIEWTHQEKQQYFDALYRDALLVQWQQGDIALVDNIKIAHWRINNGNENHNLLQIKPMFSMPIYTLLFKIHRLVIFFNMTKV